MVRINRVYTRTGDQGTTGLAGGQRLSKGHPRIEAYGTVDELNAFLGFARESLRNRKEPELKELYGQILVIQNELFDLGAELAVLPEDRRPGTPLIGDSASTRLEQEMDAMNETLSPLTSFILPGGGEVATRLHLARTVCRRAERALVRLKESGEEVRPQALRYLNRLSDWLFVAARFAARTAGEEETLWHPGSLPKPTPSPNP